MTELPVFYSDQPTCHGVAEALPSGGVTIIRTPPEQWAYGVSYARIGTFDAAGALIVRVVLQVIGGTLGVGCLDEAGAAFLDEVVVGVSSGPVVVEVVVLNPAAAGELVFRNVSDQGPSEARLESVTWSVVSTEDEVRQPPLSEPRPMTGWNRYYGDSGNNAVERIRARVFAALEAPRTVTWADGIRLVVRPGDQLSRALYISGTYEPNTLTLLRALTPRGGVFVDIGANVGVVSVVAAAWVGPAGHVFSFEPSHREHERLLEHVRLNRLDQVTVVKAAVTDREGHVDLHVATGGFAGLNTLASSFPYAGVETERIERVPAVTLDGFFERSPVSRLDVMKIDVEGAEGAVIAGAARVLRERRPVVVAEVFSRALRGSGWDRARLTGVFADTGYTLFAIEDGTARLLELSSLNEVDEQNVIALPSERVAMLLGQVRSGYQDSGQRSHAP